jgi:glycosidase
VPDSASWWQTGVIYQIYPRSFADSNRDGIGDLRGITSKLDYLSEVLGVDAIWLSPFYPSPQADFGYDVADYCDVEPAYGTLEDFDGLVAAAHDRGLRVIIDYVINHTSDRHPWFEASRASPDNARRDWYVWRDRPNNWLSVFGGSAWEFDPGTGQYYLHSFLPAQPDLNWRNPEVEAAMFEVLRFWMRRGADGFRIDVAHFAMKDPFLADNPPVSARSDGVYKAIPGRSDFEQVNSQAHPDIHALFRRLRRVVDEFPDRFTVGEIHEYDWAQWVRYYGDGDELHMPYNFALLPAGADPAKLRSAIAGLEQALPEGAWPNWVAGNHDEPRLVTRLGWEQSRALAVILLTLRGTPTIYYGDELGMRDLEVPPHLQQDPWGQSHPGYGRDGCRTPMQWAGGPEAGFTTGKRPWLPIHPEAGNRNVEAEMSDPSSHLDLYRRLLRLRRSEASLRLGSIELLPSPEPVLSFRRSHPGSTGLIVHANLSRRPLATSRGGLVRSGTDHHRPGRRFDGHLSGWEAVVVEA